MKKQYLKLNLFHWIQQTGGVAIRLFRLGLSAITRQDRPHALGAGHDAPHVHTVLRDGARLVEAHAVDGPGHVDGTRGNAVDTLLAQPPLGDDNADCHGRRKGRRY